MPKKLLLAVIALTIPVLAHARLATQLRTLADAEDSNSAAGRTYEFKEPIALSQLDRKLWFDVAEGAKEEEDRNIRITNARGRCLQKVDVNFDPPCWDATALWSDLCASRPTAYVVNGRIYSPDDLARMMPIKKKTARENGKDYVFYDADCTEITELFGNGFCALKATIPATKPLPKFHSIAVDADLWGVYSEISADSKRADVIYQLHSKKTKVEPAAAKSDTFKLLCSYRNNGDTEDFKKNASSHAMMMRHFGALLKEPAAAPSDSGKINDSNIKQGADTTPGNSTDSAGSKAQKVR